MALLEVTETEAKDIWRAEAKDWKTVTEREWEGNGDRGHRTKVVKRLSDGKCFEIGASRVSGGKYGGSWFYIYETTLDEVELREVTVVSKQWVAVGERIANGNN